MYETFYGLREKPFSLIPDPDFLFLGRLHGAALNMLEYALRGQASFTLISGEVGCGKTILVRRFLRMIDRATTVGSITNTPRSSGHLLEHILLAFDLNYRGKSEVEQYETLIGFLREQQALGRRCVLIIDEAHNLDEDSLEELRMLSNVNVDKSLALQVILVGQPEILERLNTRALRQLVQRISVNFRLLPLTFFETRRYIRHRLRVAGGSPDIFEPKSIALVHLLSGGIPRLINILCDAALVYGYGEGRAIIDAEVIQEVVGDISSGGLETLPGIEQESFNSSLLQAADELVDSLDAGEPDEEQIELPALGPLRGGSEDIGESGTQGTVEPPVSERERKGESDRGGRGLEHEPGTFRAVKPIVDTAAERKNEPRRWMRILIVFVLVMVFVVAGSGLVWFYWPLIVQERAELDSGMERPVQQPTVENGDSPVSPLPLSQAPPNGPDSEVNLPEPPYPSLPSPTGSEGHVENPGSQVQESDGQDSSPDSEEPAIAPAPTLPPINQLESQVETTAAPEDPNEVSGSETPAEIQTAGPVDLNTALADAVGVPDDMETAAADLFSLWGRDFQSVPGTSICDRAADAGLSCYDRPRRLDVVLRLNRPAIVGLRANEQSVVYALLRSRDGNNLSLTIDGHPVATTIDELDAVGTESFLLLWRPPPGFDRLLARGSRGETVLWLRQQLQKIYGDALELGAGDILDADLATAVRTFQEENDLKVDGIVGTETLIELSNAVGKEDAPRLE